MLSFLNECISGCGALPERCSTAFNGCGRTISFAFGSFRRLILAQFRSSCWTSWWTIPSTPGKSWTGEVRSHRVRIGLAFPEKIGASVWRRVFQFVSKRCPIWGSGALRLLPLLQQAPEAPFEEPHVGFHVYFFGGSSC